MGGAWGWPCPPGRPPRPRPRAAGCSWWARPRAACCWGCCARPRAARRPPLSPLSLLSPLPLPSRQSPPRRPPLTGPCSGPSCARSSWRSPLLSCWRWAQPCSTCASRCCWASWWTWWRGVPAATWPLTCGRCGARPCASSPSTACRAC